MQILILILPSEQLLDGWHTSQLHHLGILGGWHIKTQQKTLEIRGTGTLKKNLHKKKHELRFFVCLIRACKAHVSTELQHLQQSRSKFLKPSHNPFRELNLWSGWKPSQGCLHKSGVIMPYCCPTEGYHWNLLFFTEAGDWQYFASP